MYNKADPPSRFFDELRLQIEMSITFCYSNTINIYLTKETPCSARP